MILTLVSLLGLPFIVFLVSLFLPKSSSKNWAWLWVIFFIFILSNCIILIQFNTSDLPLNFGYNWFSLPFKTDFKVVFRIHNYAAWLLFVVQFVALMVLIYSIEYKKNDAHYHRYFSFLGLFIFAMNGLIVSNNLLIIFIFWELMGFASYLLIGFWYDKPKAASASKKAFLVNKVADVFFLIGILIIWASLGNLDITQILKSIEINGTIPSSVSIAGFCIFLGCMGKSAQFPMQVWLPDAMEGPTPVSALIHAATMVAAGVYLMINITFMCSISTLQCITVIGCVTAVSGAISAMSQCDIKRVLAFSTISQLGVMMVAIGLNSPEAAFFHLFTHAFFKAGLFLSAGSVIHIMHHAHDALPIGPNKYHYDKQDIRNMGGLLKIIPFSSICFIICSLALVGLPLFSGFSSKGAIVTLSYINLINGNFLDFMVFLCLLITAFLTAFYVFKTIFRTFFGELKIKNLLEKHQIKLHENGILILISISILAIMSLQFNPLVMQLYDGLTLFSENANDYELKTEILVLLVILSAIIFCYVLFKKNIMLRTKIPRWLFSASYQHFFLDNFIAKYIVTPTLITSKGILWFENDVLDKFVKYLSISQVIFANIIAFLDKFLVDGFVNVLIGGVRGFSYGIKTFQKGKIQIYILFALVFWIVLGCYLIFLKK